MRTTCRPPSAPHRPSTTDTWVRASGAREFACHAVSTCARLVWRGLILQVVQRVIPSFRRSRSGRADFNLVSSSSASWTRVSASRARSSISARGTRPVACRRDTSRLGGTVRRGWRCRSQGRARLPRQASGCWRSGHSPEVSFAVVRLEPRVLLGGCCEFARDRGRRQLQTRGVTQGNGDHRVRTISRDVGVRGTQWKHKDSSASDRIW